MTDFGDQSTTTTTRLRADGISLDRLVDLVAADPRHGAQTKADRFWVSSQQYITATQREVLEITLGGRRLVNYLTFQISRFPVIVTCEWQGEDGEWNPVQHVGHRADSTPVRTVTHPSVRMSISESVPAMVESAQALHHPQHFGKNHWVHEQWKVVPFTSNRIRFLFRRNPTGTPPRNPSRQPVAYSIALRDLQIGYRVNSHDDLPTSENGDPFASSPDLLGSRVSYSLYEQHPRKAIDGSAVTGWRCEPQPVNFAVVNFYLDMRNASGEPEVVDRFYVDPLTLGVHCNVYHSDDEPEGDFDGLSIAIPDVFETNTGNPVVYRETVTGKPLWMEFTGDTEAEVSNEFLRVHYDRGWWAGLDARTITDTTDTTNHTWFRVGPTRVYRDGDEVVLDSGPEEIRLPLDAERFRANSRFTLAASYTPASTLRPAFTRLSFRQEGYETQSVELAITPLIDSDEPVVIGESAELNVQGFVVKAEALDTDTEEWFLDEGEFFVRDSVNTQQDRGLRRNATLRMHPVFVGLDNPFGIVGGPGDRFAEMSWAPVVRDYTLRQGFMRVPPTKARYWKFEFTRLIAEPYESFLTFDRTIKVFPPHVVTQHTSVAATQTSTAQPFGVRTNINTTEANLYSDAVESLRRSAVETEGVSPTEVLYVKDPARATRVAATGWIWNYQPWHCGTFSPQFLEVGKHPYEEVRVKHTAKVGYFVGLRELTPYRVDYATDDDTTEYVERFLDLGNIQSSSGLEHVGDGGGMVAISEISQMTSKTFLSYKTVRALQFATQETDAIQVLPDPTFADSDLTKHWAVFGDADLDWQGLANVVINRGWTGNSYGEVESTYLTYGGMEGVLYGALEGANADTGSAEGGISTTPYTPSGAGRLTAVAEVSTQQQLGGPVELQIVSSLDGQVVASTAKSLFQGETSLLQVGYTPGSQTERYTYGDIEDFNDVKAAEEGGLTYTIRPNIDSPQELADSNDDTAFFAADGSPAESYGKVVLDSPTETESTGLPSDWSNVVDIVVHMRYRAAANFDWTVKNQAGTSLFTAVPITANPGIITEVSSPIPWTPQVGAPHEYVALAIDGLGVPGDRDTVEIVDWWIEADAVGGDTSYGDLERYTYRELESFSYGSDVFVRVIQSGQFSDTFNVHRVSLYDSPVVWSFSVDGGGTWWQAMDVRNDPYAVLVFPVPGKQLKWRADVYKQDASISALHIRPWYGDRFSTTEPAHDMDSLGPNKSVWDDFPATHRHPMWLERFNPIESIYEPEVPPGEETYFWRNLVINPSAESTTNPDSYTAEGGTVATGYEWIVSD